MASEACGRDGASVVRPVHENTLWLLGKESIKLKTDFPTNPVMDVDISGGNNAVIHPARCVQCLDRLSLASTADK